MLKAVINSAVAFSRKKAKWMAGAATIAAAYSLNFLSGSLDPSLTFTRASTANYFNSAGILTQAAINAPRFDYNPSTLAMNGLLIEQQSTNLVKYSNDLTQASYWNIATNVATAFTQTGIDGATSATLITDTGAGGALGISNQAVTANTNYVLSFYAKPGTLTGSNYLLYDATNLAYIANTTPWTTSGSGWTRISIPFTTPAGCVLLQFEVIRAQATTGTISICGVQLEASSCATSIIPTSGSSVTRAIDVCTNSSISGWYTWPQGTMFAEIIPYGYNGNVAVAAHIGNAANNGNDVRPFNYGTWRFNSDTGGSIAQVGTTNIAANITQKIGGSYSSNGIAGCNTGGTVYTLGAYTPPNSGNVLTIGDLYGSGIPLNGAIRSFAFYNTQLSNTQLQTISGQL